MAPYLEGVLGAIPIWLLITPLVGAVNGALFFLIVGRRPSSLPLYVVLAALAASLFQATGVVRAGEPPLSLGDVHLVATTLAAWSALAATRAVGL